MQRGPLLVELVGAPGAGKSTLTAELLERPGVVPMPQLRRRGVTAAMVAWRAGGVVATLLRRRAARRGWSRDLLVMAAYLRALPWALRRQPAEARVVVFDQGPLYTLMRPGLRDPRLAGWAAARLDEWRGLLDLVVLLDAPDDVLVQRINTRGKEHRLRGEAEAVARRQVAEDRARYAAVVDAVGRGAGAPRVLRLDTSSAAPPALVAEVLAAAGVTP